MSEYHSTAPEDRPLPPSLGESIVSGSDALEDGLLGRVEVIEAQPLAERAARFEQLHDELLAELQRSDHEGAAGA